MKRVFVSSVLFLILTICVSMIFWSCGDQEQISSSGDNQESRQIEFVMPVGSDQYVTVAKEFDLKTEEINFQVGEFSGGYTLKSGDLKSELLATKNTFIKNMTDILKLKEMSPEKDSGLYQNIQIAIDTASKNKMFFSGAIVRGSSEVLAEMSQKGIIVRIPDEKDIQNPQTIMAPQSSNHETWAPYKGTTYVSRNCIFNTLFFDNKAGFNSTSTYEHETHLYSKYANYGYSWSSNFPRAYRDTQFLDFLNPGGNLDNFTIGCAQASAIQPYTEYFTYMALCPESNIQSELWTKGQIGFRYPSWSYSTWSIFPVPNGTTSSMYKGVAPMTNTMSWSY